MKHGVISHARLYEDLSWNEDTKSDGFNVSVVNVLIQLRVTAGYAVVGNNYIIYIMSRLGSIFCENLHLLLTLV